MAFLLPCAAIRIKGNVTIGLTGGVSLYFLPTACLIRALCQQSLSAPLLSVERLSIQFGTQRVVDDVSFAPGREKTLCICRESAAVSASFREDHGFASGVRHKIPCGAIILSNRDLLSLPERQMQLLCGKSAAMIFQGTDDSLNPLMTVGQQLEETLRAQQGRKRGDWQPGRNDAGRVKSVEKPATVSTAFS
ncbi:hypothetical protein ACKU05_027550 [Klebsiella pneumoniae]